MNEQTNRYVNSTVIQSSIVFNNNPTTAATYRQKLYFYLLDNSLEALEHILLVALVYILVCLGIYRIIFYRFAYGIQLINNIRFRQCKRVLIVTAHPDDECMFFGPTILSLTRQPNCQVYLLCLSKGNYEQKGNIRKIELWNAAAVLNIKMENITLITATHLIDDPNVNWKTETIAKLVLRSLESLDIDVLITFDREGVSHHPNHSAIYYATASLCLSGLIPNRCSIYTLDSVNVCRKYFSLFDLMVSLLLSTNWFILNWHDIKVVRTAMKQHQSQMVWFRQLYIIFSRYMVINSLREMNLSDIELEMQINDT